VIAESVTIQYVSCRLTFSFHFSNNVDMIVFSLLKTQASSVRMSHGHIAPVPNLWQDT
jgi:hypothetical protein